MDVGVFLKVSSRLRWVRWITVNPLDPPFTLLFRQTLILRSPDMSC